MPAHWVFCGSLLVSFGAITTLVAVCLIGLLEQKIVRAGYNRSQMVTICYSMGATITFAFTGVLVLLLTSL